MEKLLIVDDESHIRMTIQSVLETSDLQVFTAASCAEALHVMQRESPQIALLDIRLGAESGIDLYAELRRLNPRLLVIFITGHGNPDTAIETMKIGALDYLVKPLDLDVLSASIEQARKICRQMYTPAAINSPPEAGVGADVGSDRLVGSGSAMQSICRQIGRIALQDVNVLLVGEAGTGRELIARAIYQHSRRSQAPFVSVNCAAIPEAMLESELFGHEKGAFAGAEHRRLGKIEQAHHGTVFLDSVSELPETIQVRILRLLQDGQFRRAGGTEVMSADVRVIAAAGPGLEAALASGRFRTDLYYRLRDVTINVPPLRERTEDIPELAHYLMFRFNQQLGTCVQSITPDALEKLQSHRWPGNIRELQSVLREALIVSTGPALLPEFIPLEQRGEVADEPFPSNSAHAPGLDEWQELGRFAEQALRESKGDSYRTIIQRFDRLVILQAMSLAGNMQSRAAEVLGLSRPTLRSKLRGILSSIEQQRKGNAEDLPRESEA
jgi:two-component system nitrogen regulation response regulator GlnG